MTQQNVQVNRSGRPPGQRYVLMPDSLGIRAWYVTENGQLSRGPSGHKPAALRNKMTRWQHIEVALADLGIESVRVVAPALSVAGPYAIAAAIDPWPAEPLDLITNGGDA